jgi:hypothetical protein
MKELFSKYKNIFLILIISVAIFVVYTIFFAGKDFSSNSLLGSSSQNQESVAIGKEFLNILSELKTLDLDRSLFDKKSFIILRDFSQTVEPQPSGRPNPFSPIGIDIEIPDDISSFFDSSSSGGGNLDDELEFGEDIEVDDEGFEVGTF